MIQFGEIAEQRPKVHPEPFVRGVGLFSGGAKGSFDEFWVCALNSTLQPLENLRFSIGESSLTLSGFGLGRLIVGKGEYRGCESAINTFLAILLPLVFVFFSWIPVLVGIRCYSNLLIIFMVLG